MKELCVKKKERKKEIFFVVVIKRIGIYKVNLNAYVVLDLN